MQANLLAPIGEHAEVPQSPIISSKMVQSTNLRDNFWEIGAYRRVVKRVDDGAALVDEFRTMVQERALIEKKYASMLNSWSSKWESKIDKGPENHDYSIIKAWNAMTSEATQTATLHAESDSRLDDLANRHVSTWKKANYPKTGGTGSKKYKATKQAEDGFEKAQKSWARLHAKFLKTRKVWRQGTKLLGTVQRKLQNSNLSHEEAGKLKDKEAKVLTEVKRHKEKLEQRHAALEGDETRYRKEMKEQFEFCQDVEQKRIEFLKHAMSLHIHSLPQRADSAIQSSLATIESVNADADIVNYAELKGNGMPLMIPTAEINEKGDFDRRASVSQRPKGSISISTPMTPRTAKRESLSIPALCDTELDCDDEDSDDEWGAAAPPPELDTSVEESNPSTNNSSSTLGMDGFAHFSIPCPPADLENVVSIQQNLGPALAEVTTTEGITINPPSNNVYVALYDYTGLESEELTFKVGDMIRELEGEDEQGWCKGVDHAGKIGFYPAHYVEKTQPDAMA